MRRWTERGISRRDAVTDPLDGFFFPAAMSSLMLARSAGLRGLTFAVRSTFVGRLAWVVYQRRRVPLLAWRQRRRALPAIVVSDPRRAFRAAVVVVAGPGERDQLRELIDSIRVYEGYDVKIVVAEDATGEYPPAVTATFPGVDFVHVAVPAGSASASFRPQQLAIMHLLNHYEFDVMLKLDPDSLIIAAGLVDAARLRFAADDTIGLLGTSEVDAAGAEVDFRFSMWMAHLELRWSRRWRRAAQAARRKVGRLHFAQGGAYVVSGHALREARRQGRLPFHPPWWSLMTEDFVTGLLIQATGFRVASFGAPGEPIASNTCRIPLEPEAALAGGVKAVHSVRSTPSGRPEAEVRAMFRRQRQLDADRPLAQPRREAPREA